MTILITGATGFIGKELGITLSRAGYTILAIGRDRIRGQFNLPFPCQFIECDLSREISDDKRLASVTAVIHLAGENVGAGSWSKKKKEEIMRSRSLLTANLLKSLKGQNPNLPLFISASAIGYYGNTADVEIDESSPKGSDFLAEVCSAWEDEVMFNSHAKRNVILRFGVILSAIGGAFLKMLAPFRLGLGSPLGSGEQWMSWLHLQDAINIIKLALEHPQMHGIYNAVSPHPVTNKHFSEILADNLKQKLKMPIPAWMITLGLGDKAQIVLHSQKIFPTKLLKQKTIPFTFQFPTIELALNDCCSYYKDGDLLFYNRQYIDLDLDHVFQFFAEAKNLEKITPDQLHFEILKMTTEQIEQGTLIDYRLKIHGIPVNWRTHIDSWNPPLHFTDIQLKGPYAKWHHLHSFEKLGSGTLMTDCVTYRLPLGKLGEIVAKHFIQSDINNIFQYRQKFVATNLKRNTNNI